MGQNLPCFRRNIFRICLASPFGLVRKTAFFICIDDACKGAKSKEICDKEGKRGHDEAADENQKSVRKISRHRDTGAQVRREESNLAPDSQIARPMTISIAPLFPAFESHDALTCDAVEKLDEREDGAVHTLDFGIFRFDDVVLVRRMRAATVAESEGTGGKMERLAGENVAGPGACAARKNDGIHSAFAVDLGFNSNERGIGRRAVGIVAAGHADFDVAETFFREMSFESGEGFGGGHVRNEAQIEFGDRSSK